MKLAELRNKFIKFSKRNNIFLKITCTSRDDAEEIADYLVLNGHTYNKYDDDARTFYKHNNEIQISLDNNDKTKNILNYIEENFPVKIEHYACPCPKCNAGKLRIVINKLKYFSEIFEKVNSITNATYYSEYDSNNNTTFFILVEDSNDKILSVIIDIIELVSGQRPIINDEGSKLELIVRNPVLASNKLSTLRNKLIKKANEEIKFKIIFPIEDYIKFYKRENAIDTKDVIYDLFNRSALAHGTIYDLLKAPLMDSGLVNKLDYYLNNNNIELIGYTSHFHEFKRFFENAFPNVLIYFWNKKIEINYDKNYDINKLLKTIKSSFKNINIIKSNSYNVATLLCQLDDIELNILFDLIEQETGKKPELWRNGNYKVDIS